MRAKSIQTILLGQREEHLSGRRMLSENFDVVEHKVCLTVYNVNLVMND